MRRKRTPLALTTLLALALCGANPSPVLAQTTTTSAPAARPDPVSFGYLPAGFAVAPVVSPLNWDDFSESYLYESASRADWTVSTTGAAFADANPCKQIPAAFRPVIARTRLTFVDQDGTPETRTERVAVFSGGAAVRRWLFDGDTAVTPLKLSKKAKTSSISALVACSTGTALIAQGRLTRAQLAARYRDPSMGGALVMTDWAPASNPVEYYRSVSGVQGNVDINIESDPRTVDWFPFIGSERATVRGTTALVRRDKAGEVAVLWFASPGRLVTVSSSTVPLDELVKIANGLTVPAP